MARAARPRKTLKAPKPKKMVRSEFYAIEEIKPGEVWKAIKYVSDEKGFRAEVEHEIKGGECDCKGFKYRQDCRHLKMIHGGMMGPPIELKKARRVVREAIQRVDERQEFFRRMVFDEWNMNEKRQVVGAKLRTWLDSSETRKWKSFWMIWKDLMMQIS